MDRLLGGSVKHHGNAYFLLFVRREIPRLKPDQQQQKYAEVGGRRYDDTAPKCGVGATEPANSITGSVQNPLQHAARLTRPYRPRALAWTAAALAVQPAAQPW
jgi:hypothetical protein